MRSRLVVVAVYGAVMAGLVAATTAFVVLDKSVTISVDGEVTHLSTYATSVDAVLHRAGVLVGPRDSLTPAASTRVHDGTTITLNRARPVTLTIDGVDRELWLTGLDVDQVLQQSGIPVRGANVSASRGTRVPLSGMTIRVDMPHAISIRVDGVTRSVVSAQPTVGAVLADAGLTLGPADTVSVALETRPTDAMVVVIARLTSGPHVETSPIPFTSTTAPDPSGFVGTKRVVRAGRNGTLSRTYQVTYTDGVPTAKTLVSEQVTAQPVQEIVGVGTKPRPVYTPSADGLNWAALAGCESGGRPNAIHVPFYGMYQFSLGTWQAVGGWGLPSDAPASEQTYRAQLLYKRSNWQTQWPVCGHFLFS